MENERITGLAAKIAQLIASESKPGDLSSIQKSLDEISLRLDKLETTSAIPQSALRDSTETSASSIEPLAEVNPQSIHPSHERFNIAEAIADSVFDKYKTEKVCTFEPHDKPCDHCSMCSSRGF